MPKVPMHLTIDFDIWQYINSDIELNGKISSIVNEFLRNYIESKKNNIESSIIKTDVEIQNLEDKLKILKGLKIGLEEKQKDKIIIETEEGY